MNTSSINLAGLLKNLDDLQLERRPLAQHTAASASAMDRELYAAQLASILLIGKQISEWQTRLYKQLLLSLKLDKTVASFYERASTLTVDDLRQFCQFTQKQNLAHSFLLDALVLSRLTGKLLPEQAHVLSEWVALMGISQSDLLDLVHLSDVVLQQPTNHAPIFAFGYDRAKVWHEFCYQKLTVEKLQAGIKGGLWLVDEHLDVNWPWSIQDANVVFASGKISTACAGDVLVKNSQMMYACMSFDKGSINFESNQFNDCSFEFSSSKFIGSKLKVNNTFLADEEASVFIFNSCSKVDFLASHFVTKNIRTILVQQSSLQIQNCVFEKCGSPYLVGGAIRFNSNSQLLVENVRFLDCIAKIAGAMFLKSLHSGSKIKECAFENCSGVFFANQKNSWGLLGFSGGGLLTESYRNDSSDYRNLITNTSFVNSSISLPYRSSSGSTSTFYNCNFKSSPVCTNSENGYLFAECAFENQGQPNQVVYVHPNSEWLSW